MEQDVGVIVFVVTNLIIIHDSRTRATPTPRPISCLEKRMPRPSLNIRCIQSLVVLHSGCLLSIRPPMCVWRQLKSWFYLIKNFDGGSILKKEDRKEDHCHDNHATGEMVVLGDV